MPKTPSSSLFNSTSIGSDSSSMQPIPGITTAHSTETRRLLYARELGQWFPYNLWLDAQSTQDLVTWPQKLDPTLRKAGVVQ